MKTTIYIDSANLHRASEEVGFQIDYKRFRNWLRQKYCAEKVYMFIGYIAKNNERYEFLKECGFILIFKETVSIGNSVKGNCDAELVLKSVSDFFRKEFENCILITGDGDFSCLVDFLKDEKVLAGVLAPNTNKCSCLLKNKPDVEITFLNELYHKFSTVIKNHVMNDVGKSEKAPDADVSA